MKLDSTFSTADNYKLYRALPLTPPVLPFLGTIMSGREGIAAAPKHHLSFAHSFVGAQLLRFEILRSSSTATQSSTTTVKASSTSTSYASCREPSLASTCTTRSPATTRQPSKRTDRCNKPSLPYVYCLCTIPACAPVAEHS